MPDLPAGRATEVKFSAAIPDGAPGLTYFIQVFDHEGHEVRTNAMSNAWAYYRLRELVTLKEARENYVRQNQGANHQLVPVLMPKPLLPEGDDRRPTAGSAVLDVDADGIVTAVELEGVDSPAYSEAISEAMGGWLFLPQLRAGTPVATRVKVPLAF